MKDSLAAALLRLSLRMSALVPLEVARSGGRLLGYVVYRMRTKTALIIRTNIELAYKALTPLEERTTH